MTTVDVARPRRAAVGRRALAVFLVLHGIAHLVGAQAAFEAIAAQEGVAYLAGAWEPRGAALVVLGTAWVLLAMAFTLTGGLIWRRHPRGRSWLLRAASASLVLSLLALPMAWIGAALNVVLLVLAWRWHPALR